MGKLYNSQNQTKIGPSARQPGVGHSCLQNHTIINRTEKSEPEISVLFYSFGSESSKITENWVMRVSLNLKQKIDKME